MEEEREVEGEGTWREREGKREGGRKKDGENRMNPGMSKDSYFWFVSLGIEKPILLLPSSLPPST